MRFIPLICVQFASASIAPAGDAKAESGGEEVDHDEFCQMMTLSPSAICKGEVCVQAGEQKFEDAALNGLSCSRPRIQGFTTIYNDSRRKIKSRPEWYYEANAQTDCFGTSMTYAALVHCRALEVVNPAAQPQQRRCRPSFFMNFDDSKYDPETGSDNVYLIRDSVPGSFIIGSDEFDVFWRESLERSVNLEWAQGLAEESAADDEKLLIEFLMEVTGKDIAASILLPMIREINELNKFQKCESIVNAFQSLLKKDLATDSHYQLASDCLRKLLRLGVRGGVEERDMQGARSFLADVSGDWMVPGDRVAVRKRIFTQNSQFRVKKLPKGTIMAQILGSLKLDKSDLEHPFDEKIIEKFISQMNGAYIRPSLRRLMHLPGMFRGLVSAAGAPNDQWLPSTELYNPGGLFTYGALMICLDEFGNMDSSQGTNFAPDFASPTVLRMLNQLNLEEILYNHLLDYKKRTSLLGMMGSWGPDESTVAPTPLSKIQSIFRSAVAASIEANRDGAESKSVGRSS